MEPMTHPKEAVCVTTESILAAAASIQALWAASMVRDYREPSWPVSLAHHAVSGRDPTLRVEAIAQVLHTGLMVGSMLEQCGGYPRVAQIVFVFYDRVLQSPRLRSFFVGVDMRRLIEHQTKLLCSLMEGPVSYSDEQLAAVHRHLRIDDATFDELVDVLEQTLADFQIPIEHLRFVMAQIQMRRPFIVSRINEPFGS
jgi:hemoglobin